MFVKAYSKERRSNLSTPSGTELETTYAYEVDKKGMKNLVENGKKNVYEEIQEHLEDTKIENIIANVVAGDTSALRSDVIYDDITGMPNNLLDAMNQVHALEETYANAPASVKEMFPTLESYVTQAGSEAWMIANGYIQQEQHLQTETEKIAKEVKETTPNES